MASQLGHGSPLGAFHNLGHRVQQRLLGASSLSILNLATFYPYGFPAIAPERSVSESQPSSSDDSTVVRQIDTSAPNTQLSGAERTSIPSSKEQADPFRTSLQRYFKPETSTSLKVETTVSNPATASTANVKTALSQNTDLISENHTLQRLITEEIPNEDIPKPAPDSSQLSGTHTADFAAPRQNQQPSPSTSQVSADSHSEIQRATELTNGQTDKLSIDSPIVESNGANTPALTQRPPAASINISQSIQSLRTPFASVQHSDEQPTQSVEQPSDFNTPSDTDSKPLVSPNTSSSLDTHPALQPDISGPPVQRLHEATEAPSSLLSRDQNLAATSALESDQTLQRQPDSSSAAIPAHPATPQTKESSSESSGEIQRQPDSTAEDSLTNSDNEQAAIAPTPSITAQTIAAQTSSHTEIQKFQNLSTPDSSSIEIHRSPSAPTEQSSATEPTTANSLNIQPADSVHQEIRRTTDTDQTDQLAASTASTTNPTQIAPVTDIQSPSGVTSAVAAQITGKAPQSVTSMPPVSELSSAIQRTTGQSHTISDENLANTDGSLAVNSSLERSQTNATNSISAGNGESSDIADSVQRSIAPSSPTSQTSASIKIQRSSNRSGPDISFRETNLLSSPPTYQPSSETESIALDPTNGESVANSDESIQREAVDAFLENNSPTAQPSASQQYTIHPSVAEPNKESSNTPAVNNSADLVQRMAESSTSKSHAANLSIASNQTSYTNPSVSDVALQPADSQSTVEPSQNINELSSSSTSESNQSQLTSSTPAAIQRAVNRNSLTPKTLGHSSRRQLPVLQPLGILKPLPSLKTDKLVSPSSVSPQSQSGTIQRQIIPNEWSNLESLVTGLASNSQQNASTSPETTQQPITEETANSTLSANIDSSNDNSAMAQRQPSETDSSIQRQADSIPNEWSNLEDLVTHLQSNTSNPAAKTAFSNKLSNSQSTVKSAPQPQQTTQPVKLDKPANVTVQRQIANPPSVTKPTIIQACQDTSSKANSTNTDEQTAEHIADSYNYSQYVELLAQEVYSLLSQRLSLEQERRGPKYPR